MAPPAVAVLIQPAIILTTFAIHRAIYVRGGCRARIDDQLFRGQIRLAKNRSHSEQRSDKAKRGKDIGFHTRQQWLIVRDSAPRLPVPLIPLSIGRNENLAAKPLARIDVTNPSTFPHRHIPPHAQGSAYRRSD